MRWVARSAGKSSGRFLHEESKAHPDLNPLPQYCAEIKGFLDQLLSLGQYRSFLPKWLGKG